MLPVQRDRPLPIFRFCHELQISLLHQHRGKAGPGQRVRVAQ